MSTRIGKIARLPRQVREDLNCRIEDGDPATALVPWLNALPEVQEVLEDHFGARPITEQNLSEWKTGGYADWLRHQHSRDLLSRLIEHAEDFEEDSQSVPLSDRLAAVLTVELSRTVDDLLAQTDDPLERWRRLRQFLRELVQLRRQDHKAGNFRIKWENYQRELDRLEQKQVEREESEAKQRFLAPLLSRLPQAFLAKVFGDGEDAMKVAGFILEVQNDLPVGTLSGDLSARAAKAAKPDPNPSGGLPSNAAGAAAPDPHPGESN